MDKLKFLKNRKIVLVLGVVFLVLVVILFILLSSDPEPEAEAGSVVLPLSYDNTIEVNIDDEVARNTQNSADELLVFKIANVNHSSLVDFFVSKVGKSSWEKTNIEDIFYTWVPDQRESLYLIDYDTAQDRAFFRFQEPVPIQLNPSGTLLTEADLQLFLDEFVSTYFGLSFNYMNIDVKKTGEGYRIEANREIEGTPLYTAGPETYSDYIEITEYGDLLMGQILLMEFEIPGALVGIVPPRQLNDLINNPAYPRDFNQEMPVGFSYSEVYEDFEYEQGALGDAPDVKYEDLIEPVGSCSAQEMQLVYYFVRTTEEYLPPTYRIDCKGDVDIAGENYLVPITVFTNALDPDVVYVHPQAGE